MSSTTVTPRAFVRRNRAVLALALVAVLAIVLITIINGVGRGSTLDPDSYEPSGGRALATILDHQGVHVARTRDVPTTLAGANAKTTVFVPTPQLLTSEELSDLEGGGVHLVIANALPDVIDTLGLDAQPDGAVDEDERDPGCGFAPAEAAGTVKTGGIRYGGSDRAAVRCYDGTLVSLPDQDIVLLGGGKALTNERLGTQGNAALGLQLLGQSDDLRWLIPDPDRDTSGEKLVDGYTDLMPRWVVWGVLQLAVALVFVMLWRARRLGRVVPEPLPVVVRAAETVEGRGRLYRASGARDAAAEALRSGARDRLAARLGAGRHATPEVLVDLVAARSPRPAPEIQELLYGPPPADDAALLQLARTLDALTLEVSGS